MSSMIRIHSERLHDPEEGYKKGGKVRKGKKKAKAKKSRKATGKRRRAVKAEAQRYLPMGGALPTTGMGSFVFGPSQAPSYFRAVGPDQQVFASLPGTLKTLQEQQATLLREVERQTERLRADERMARDMAQADEKDEVTRSISPFASQPPTPRTSYSPIVGSKPFMPPPINTLLPLERQRSMTPDIITPMMAPPSSMMSSIPQTAIPVYSWSQSMSSREAGYRGADESLPVQAPASGANMIPLDVVHDAVPDSAFVPLNAAAPEDVDAALKRAKEVGRSRSAPAKGYIIPGTEQRVIPRPTTALNRVRQLSDIEKTRPLTAEEDAERKALFTAQLLKTKARLRQKKLQEQEQAQAQAQAQAQIIDEDTKAKLKRIKKPIPAERP